MVEPPKTDVTAPAGDEPPTQSPEGTTVTLPPPKTPEQNVAHRQRTALPRFRPCKEVVVNVHAAQTTTAKPKPARYYYCFPRKVNDI